MDQELHERRATATRWAPWWAYLGAIVGANYLRKAALPEGGGPALRVALALAFSAVLFVVITVLYRATQR